MSTHILLSNHSTEPPHVGGIFRLRLVMDRHRQVQFLSRKPMYFSARWSVSGEHERGVGELKRTVKLTDEEMRDLLAERGEEMQEGRAALRAAGAEQSNGLGLESGFDKLIHRRITSFEEGAVNWPGVVETAQILMALPWSAGSGLALMAGGLVLIVLSRRVFLWRCAGCGYDLRATPAGLPCPECGVVPKSSGVGA